MLQVTVGDLQATGCDIHRTTAEQQAARKALILLGLDMEELTMLDNNQITLQAIARKMPGLNSIVQQKKRTAKGKDGCDDLSEGKKEQLQLESA